MKITLLKISLQLLLFIGIISLSVSCNSLNEPEEIPAYISIDTIKLATSADEGSNSHKITDAWVFVNSQLIGAYDLPGSIPVLATGEQEVVIFAGILENGILSTRDIYPFYDRYRIITDLPPGKEIKIEPTVTYVDNAVFSFIEDFENSNRFGVDLDGNENTSLEVSSEQKLDGNYSGKAVLEGDNNILEFTSNLFYDVENDGQSVYLEFDYKSDIIFEVGIIGLRNGLEEKVYKLGITPRDDWNKIYVSLTGEIGALNASSYKVVFRAIKPEGTDTAELFFDNIKLVHF